MTRHNASTGPSLREQITLRSPAELADALPFLLGFHPDDSIVLVALHGPQGRFGGRLRLGIPQAREDWPEVSDQIAECLVTGSERHGSRPDGIILFLCQDPSGNESAQDVMERLRPLAQRLRLACGAMEVPVFEALCMSGGRFWSYCCPDPRCCPAEGVPLGIPGTSVMAATAAYAGIQVRGTLREMEARLTPLTAPGAREQETALDAAAVALVPRMLNGTSAATVRDETLTLLNKMIEKFRGTPPIADPVASDRRDDGLLDPGEAAAAIIGLQDRIARDRAAEWMEGTEADPALRLWRALARRCVGSYAEHSAPPLTLAGWVAWSSGDEPFARIALGCALRADPDYLFARLLHQACNEGLDPERLRRCLRRERADQAVHAAVHEELARGSDAPGGAASSVGTPGGSASHADAAQDRFSPGPDFRADDARAERSDAGDPGADDPCADIGGPETESRGTTGPSAATGAATVGVGADEAAVTGVGGQAPAESAAGPAAVHGPAGSGRPAAAWRRGRRNRPGPSGPGAPRGSRDGRRPGLSPRPRRRPGRRGADGCL